MEFNLAYGCGNAYLFDYGDRYLATKGSQWRNGKPTIGQRDFFLRLSEKVKDISAGSISFPEPDGKKGEYGAAIAALNAEMIMLSGRKIESEEARKFIIENLSARVVSEESIHVTIDENRDPTIEVALNRAIANFSNSKEGDFANYLKKIILENQIVLNGNRVRISHSKFPVSMTERQWEAARERIQGEIRLYVPHAELDLCGFPVSAPAL